MLVSCCNVCVFVNLLICSFFLCLMSLFLGSGKLTFRHIMVNGAQMLVGMYPCYMRSACFVLYELNRFVFVWP